MMGRRSASAFPFESDEHPSVMVIYVAMSLLLLLAGGAALDCARVFDMRVSIQSAVKAGSEAAAHALRHASMSDDEVEAVALSHFEKGIALARRVGTIDTPTVSIDRRAQAVTVAGTGTVSMTVGRLYGLDDISVPATATAAGTSSTLASHRGRLPITSRAGSGGS